MGGTPDTAVPSLGRELPPVDRPLPSPGHALPLQGGAVLSPGRALPPVNRALPSLGRALPWVGSALPGDSNALPRRGRPASPFGSRLPSDSRGLPSLGSTQVSGGIGRPKRGNELLSFAFAIPSRARRQLSHPHADSPFATAMASFGSTFLTPGRPLLSLGRRGPWHGSSLLRETCDRPSAASEPPSFGSGPARPGRPVSSLGISVPSLGRARAPVAKGLSRRGKALACISNGFARVPDEKTATPEARARLTGPVTEGGSTVSGGGERRGRFENRPGPASKPSTGAPVQPWLSTKQGACHLSIAGNSRHFTEGFVSRTSRVSRACQPTSKSGGTASLALPRRHWSNASALSGSSGPT